jgi:high affinity Mn2+ porin
MPTTELACAAASAVAAQVSVNSLPAPSIVQPPGGEQNWNWHIQNTDIVQGYPGFSAKYSGPNSLPTGGETRETVSLDLMAGVRLWRGAEAHVNGMMWQGYGVNNALGVDGFPNGEAFRLGITDPNGAVTRFFIRQTIGLGGEQENVPDDDFTLAGKQDISRITIILGRFSAKDIFDNNAYANDPHTQFMNWALMANEAWDYPADAIGYTTGMAIGLNQPKWTLRYGFFQVPRYSNSLTADDQIFKWPHESPAQNGPLLDAWGMVTEFERRFAIKDHPGVIRFLAYLNRANMGGYQDAVDNPTRPADITASAQYRYKYGFGLNLEQESAKNVGVFSASAGATDRIKPGCSATWITRRRRASASKAKRGSDLMTLLAWRGWPMAFHTFTRNSLRRPAPVSWRATAI